MIRKVGKREKTPLGMTQGGQLILIAVREFSVASGRNCGETDVDLNPEKGLHQQGCPEGR